MNFLSPDDIFSGVRRKSLCNGSLLQLTSNKNSHHNASDNNSLNVTPSKAQSKKERRRGSFNEATTNGGSNASSGGRRASLVSRWFKHISDAAEQYKPRSKNANHEPVDDPAIATIPHSNTKESLELTPERPPPASAIATVTTTPLAPMMPVATATSVNVNNNNINNNDHHNVQLRNGRRESTPTAGSADHKMRLSHNELSPSIGSSTAAMSSASTASLSSTSAAVNRTMSTRSCGEPNNNNGGYENSSVTLRHTQSARQANGHNADIGGDEFSSSASGGSKRDSASIVYSNNSNNTRTLMQSSPPLVEPTAIQISISPAHTAEPVLTPAERLRRLDASIRDGLLEKQKIICDMFRLPVEHFHEIVDIAAMPEAPKDSADIALAAYAQVQSLTEVLNEYMHATHEQEVSAVSTAVCDLCHEKQQQLQQQQQHHLSHRPLTPLTAASSNSSSTSTMNSIGSSTTTQIAASGSASTATTSADIPPPLPPPNKQTAQQQTPTARTPSNVRTVLQNALLDEDIHEDDDGYCEIDELRLPALPPTLASKATKASSPPPPLPPPAGSFKPPPLPPPPAAVTQQQQQQQSEEKSSSNATTTSTTLPDETSTPASAVAQTNTAELVKRQSTISADSIPEESADEVTQALNEDKVSEPIITGEGEENKHKEDKGNAADSKTEQSKTDENMEAELQKVKLEVKEENEEKENDKNESDEGKTTENIAAITTADSESSETISSSNNANATELSASKKCEEIVDKTAKAESVETKTTNNANAEEHMEVNDAYETLSTLNSKLNSVLAMVDNSTQTIPPLALSLSALATNAAIISGRNTNLPVHCGPNRIQHANSLEPSVPCHALNTIVSSLNAQISLLLPKINERDMERERLRKENQHLRELLNAMHERQRVEPKLETPTDVTAKTNIGDGKTADETDGGNSNKNNPHTNTSNSPAADATAATAATASNADDSSTANESIEGSLATPKITVNNATASTTATVSADSSKPTAPATTTATESEN